MSETRAGEPDVEPDPCLRLDDQLCFALYAATTAVVRAYRPLLKDIGLTYPQYLVMMALWEDDDVSLSTLAARLDLPVHGLSPVVERLDQAALLVRSADPVDRRAVRVVLTGAGRELEREASRAQRRVQCRTDLTDAALARLRTELHAVTAALNAETADRD